MQLKEYILASLVCFGVTSCEQNRYEEFKDNTVPEGKITERQLQDNYRAMIVDGHEWVVRVTLPYPPFDASIQCQRIEGDTIVGEQNYKKLMVRSENEPDNWNLKALLREDIKNQQIFVLINGKEELKYDFGLGIGGTTKLYLNHLADYNVRLNRIIEKKDRKGNIFRQFDYLVGETKEYYTVYECFGTIQGIVDNTLFIDGDCGYALVEIRDAQGDVILTAEDLVD